LEVYGGSEGAGEGCGGKGAALLVRRAPTAGHVSMSEGIDLVPAKPRL
jgi:hypothetical protein